jgi:amino acid transporter
LFYVGSQEKHVPSLLGMISAKRATPVPSLLVSCVMSLVMLTSRDVYVLINYFSVTHWMWTGIVTAGLIHLRLRKPDMVRPIRFSLALPIIFTACCFLLTLFAIYEDPKSAFWGFLLMFAGVPVYYAQRRMLQTNFGKLTLFTKVLIEFNVLTIGSIHDVSGVSFTLTLQKLLLVMTPDELEPCSSKASV